MKHLWFVAILLLFAGCPAEYEVPKGHVVSGGAAGVNNSNMSFKVSDDAGASGEDGTTTPPDVGEDAPSTEVGADAACTESEAVCTCLAEKKYHTLEYCECKLDEADEHPGFPNWCDCHWLVCVADPPDQAHFDAAIEQCLTDFTADCQAFM
jgi:hypothetical protein